MNFYKTETVNEQVTIIRSMTGELLYLIEGSRQAVLIDTCLGVGSLRDLIKTLTDKPLCVLLTHGHVDHASGAAEFDCVYMNRKDQELYRRHCKLEERIGYLCANLGSRYSLLSEENFILADPQKKFMDLTENMVFDLGELHIEVHELPGHTKGSVVFLLPELRVLILGDACNNSTFLFDEESSTVTAYLKVLQEIEGKLRGKFDRVFLSHHVMEANADIIENMIAVCRDVLENKADDLPFEFMGMKAWIAKQCNKRFEREDGKSGNLIYSKSNLI